MTRVLCVTFVVGVIFNIPLIVLLSSQIEFSPLFFAGSSTAYEEAVEEVHVVALDMPFHGDQTQTLVYT